MSTDTSFYSSLRKKSEILFDKLARYVYRNRVKTLCFVFVVTLLFGSQLPKLEMDSSNEGMLHKNDPIRVGYNEFREQFGRDDAVLIVLKPEEIFSPGFLKNLKSLHHDLEENVPFVREVSSLINARKTHGEGDTLIVGELLSQWPEEEVDLNLLKQRVLANPLYTDNIISDDGKYAVIMVETEALLEEPGSDDDFLNENFSSEEDEDKAVQNFLGDAEKGTIIQAIHDVVDRYENKGFGIFVTGGPAVEDYFNRTSLKDAIMSSVIGSIPVLLIPLFLFRRFSGVVLPYSVIMPSMLSAMGCLIIFDMPFTIMAGALPPFLIAVGTGDSIHILTIFYRRFNQGDSKEDAIAHAFVHSGPAVLTTTITTAAGLMSLGFAKLFALAHMGIMCAAGVTMALFYTLFLLPSLIAIFPLKIKDLPENKSNLMDSILLFFADFSIKHPKKITGVCLVILALSLFISSQNRFSNYTISYLPDKLALKAETLYIDKVLNGIIPLEIVIDTKKENGVHDPEVLNTIETLTRDIEKINNPEVFVGKIFSINDILKEINQALHENDPEFYTIPQDKQTISQEFLLFENSGSDDLEKVVDSTFQKTRITIKTSWVDSICFDPFIKDIEMRFNQAFSGRADISVTGLMALMARSMTAAIQSTAKSYVLAFFVISVMMVCLVGNIKLGIFSMVPNILPIVSVLCIMELAGMPIGMTTLLSIGVCIGIVVDDTVHFIYVYRRNYDHTGDPVISMQETFLSTGRAVLITTLILVCVFSSNLFCDMKNIVRFGGINSLIILIALLFDFLLLPALLFLLSDKKPRQLDSLS